MKKSNYLNDMYKLGNRLAIITIIVILLIPTIIAIYFNVSPDVGRVFKSSLGLMAIFIPITVSEVVSFTPVMGTSIYIALITGNVTNLKLPVLLSVTKAFNLEQGSEENDVISAIVISISSIVTIIIIAIGALLLVPVKSIFTNESVQVAINNILPALFGGLALVLLSENVGGGVRIKGRLKGFILPAIVVLPLALFLPKDIYNALQGILIILTIGLTYLSYKFLYRRKYVTVEIEEEE